jgi:biopolymer transport protein ExbD
MMSARSLTFRPSRISEPEPFASMNITPLIDVLLVLIVTLIMTIPIMTHKIPIELPGRPLPGTYTPVIHRIDLDAGGNLFWDGARISEAALPARLAAVRDDPTAQLQFGSDGATRYERFDQTLAVIKRAGITRLGFVGNERFRNFDVNQ